MSVDDGIPRLSMAGAVRLGGQGGMVTPRNDSTEGPGDQHTPTDEKLPESQEP